MTQLSFQFPLLCDDHDDYDGDDDVFHDGDDDDLHDGDGDDHDDYGDCDTFC